MLKYFLIFVAIFVVSGVIIEFFALQRMRSNVARYATYWHELPAPKNATFTYVALGDSAAQGIGASQPQKGYVGLFAEQIAKEQGKTVRIINLSVSGAVISDVTNGQIPQLSKYKPDLITLDIGSNDVARTYDSRVFTADYAKLAAVLPKNTIVGNIPYFGGRIRRNTQALDANKTIAGLTKKNHLKVADLHMITRQRNSLNSYAPDLFHPSNAGYKNWAAAFWLAYNKAD